MAGARVVEDDPRRGGGDAFDIIMFGDEPYGNYNRILLSNVLNGDEDAERRSSSTRSSGTARTASRCTPASGSRASTASAQGWCSPTTAAEPYDVLVFATGSRPFVPPMEGMRRARQRLHGVFVFRTLDDCRAMPTTRRARTARAVVIGGGLLGLEAARGLLTHGLDVTSSHAAGTLMGVQLDEAGGEVLQRRRSSSSASRCTPATTRPRSGHRTRSPASSSPTARASPRHGRHLRRASARTSNWPARSGLAVERAIVVDDQMRTSDDDDVFGVGECVQHRGVVYGLVAPLWEQAKVLADHVTGTNPDRRYHGLEDRHQAQGDGRRARGRWASTEPERDTDEVVQFTRSRAGIYKKVVIRDGKLVGATLLGDLGPADDLMQAFDRGAAAAGDAGRAVLRPRRRQPARGALADLPDDAPDLQLQRRQQGHHRATRVKAAARRRRASMDKHARRHRLRRRARTLVQADRRGGRRRDVEEDPSANWYVPASRWTSRRSWPRSASAACRACPPSSRHSRRTATRTRRRKMGWRRCSRASGATSTSTSATPGSSTTACTRTSRRTARSRSSRRSTAASPPPTSCAASARSPKKYDVPMVKLTGGQRIDLLGITKDDLPEVWADLGMPSRLRVHARRFRTCKTCVGTEFCRFGTNDSHRPRHRHREAVPGVRVPGEDEAGRQRLPAELRRGHVKDVGVVAIEGGEWEIYVGGAAGAHVRKSDVLCRVDDAGRGAAASSAGSCSTTATTPSGWSAPTTSCRGSASSRSAPSSSTTREGIADRLDAAMQDAVDAYVDPWSRAETAVTAASSAPRCRWRCCRMPADRAESLLGWP